MSTIWKPHVIVATVLEEKNRYLNHENGERYPLTLLHTDCYYV